VIYCIPITDITSSTNCGLVENYSPGNCDTGLPRYVYGYSEITFAGQTEIKRDIYDYEKGASAAVHASKYTSVNKGSFTPDALRRGTTQRCGAA